MTSENYQDSEDEANPLNQHMAKKPARGVKFANSLVAEDDESGYHSQPESQPFNNQRTIKRTSPSTSPRGDSSPGSSLRGIGGLKKSLKKTETKVFNFREDIQQMKENMNVEQIWLDFGKQHTKI